MPLKGTAHALLFSAPVSRQTPIPEISDRVSPCACLGTGAENKHPKLLLDLCPRPSASGRVKIQIRTIVMLQV